MRVWVSGARGKLGTEVCRQLSALGHTVIEADLKPGGTEVVDLLDRRAVARSLRPAEAIIHCAGIPSPERVTPANLVQNNTMSTFNALEEAWAAGIQTAVLASSGSIYGTAWSPDPLFQPYLPVDESSPLQYVDPYALTKDILERIGQMYARRGMHVTALRLHWILTRQEVHDLADTISEPVGARTLWGYVELEDAARACLLALTPSPGHDPFQALLIAANDTLTSRPTEELIAEHFPSSELRSPLPRSVGGFDISRAERIIGWTPQFRRCKS